MDTPPTKSPHATLTISHIAREQPRAKPKFMRKLGGTEAMYNFYLSQGTEVLSMMSSVESVYPVPEVAVRWALQCLMVRHPLLRSCIKRDMSTEDQPAMFEENSFLEVDFLVIQRSDWLNVILEEVHEQFHDDTKPLWRCRMLNTASVNVGCTMSDEAFKSLPNDQRGLLLSENLDDRDKDYHKTVFVFIAHHSIIDGGYMTWLFQEFINFLDAYIIQTPIGDVKELPLLPPIEDSVRYTPLAKSGTMYNYSESHNCRVRMCYDKVDSSALHDYFTQFKDEITSLSNNEAKNDILFFKYSKQTTTALMHACARAKSKPPGVLMAATIMAMLDLIYPDSSSKDVFEIPVDFMLDLRRQFKIETLSNDLIPYYTGVATSYIPFSVQLKLAQRPVSRSEFLRIANCLDAAVQYYTVNNNAIIIDKVKHENEYFVKSSVQELKKQVGKSPFVLCFSNIGRLDNLLHESLRERIRLTNVHGHSSTLVDQMPIFFVTMITVNGRLMCSISYCKSYTSASTALRYMDNMRKYLDQTLVQSVL